MAHEIHAVDVAEYILRKQGHMTAMKLQKLVYYSQAWSLVWDERPLFPEEIQAWANGPVVPALYERHRGSFTVATVQGHPESLDQLGRETVDAVLDYYGPRSAQYLSDLTHLEDPWKLARQGLAPGSNSSAVITTASMAEYYGGLEPDTHAQETIQR